jgi:cyclopropane fatty-acyl-phospholipid synthase-like methyltransferase
MGQGLPLRRGVFDGAISISAVQWLCNADRSNHDPRKRLKRFFETLYACLARGARAVLQVRRTPPGPTGPRKRRQQLRCRCARTRLVRL